MASLRTALLATLVTAFSDASHAIDDGCIYDSNKEATVLIEYSCTLTDGNGTCSSYGTGFIISNSGYILTNNHVLSPEKNDLAIASEEVKVRVGGRLANPQNATILSRDKATDLALLKIPLPSDKPNWPKVSISTAGDLAVGSPLAALGFSNSDLAIIPGGQKTAENTYTDNDYKPWWQTNLALNPGNSGGPVFGESGTVVGISVAYIKSSQLVSYIIPIHYAQHYLDLAGAIKVRYAKCATFPECRNEAHGVERYAIDEIKESWSAWRSGGYNRPAYCNDWLTELRQTFPNSRFEFVSDNEHSRQDIFRHAEYQYYCSFRRTEQPIYRLARTEFCLP